MRVAAASDLRFALDETAAAFGTACPEIPLDIVYGSSGALYQQIRNGAPFDLYFSADAEYPRLLAAEGFVVERSQRLYAVGRIVVWRPEGSVGRETLSDPAIRKLVLANPRHAPYGQAAEAALRSLGVYDEIESKIVLGDNVAQALQFVQSGGADAGIVALSLALAPSVGGEYWEIPLDAYPRMDQSCAIISGSREPEQAAQFRDFVLGAAGRVILARYGFAPPETD